MTPEGEVKADIKKILAKYPHYGWWPVPCGYGENSLDWVGCINGQFVAIEAKAPRKKATDLQLNIIDRIRKAGGLTFVCDGRNLEALETWLKRVSASHS